VPSIKISEIIAKITKEEIATVPGRLVLLFLKRN